MSLSERHDESMKFLRLLYPSGPWTITAIHPKNRSSTGDAEIHTRTYSTEEDVLRFLRDRREWNLYYNVNPVVAPVQKKPERWEISAVHYLQVDCDPMKGESPEAQWEGIKSKLSMPANMPPPTTLVRSGNGGNALWAIEEPLPIKGDSPAEREASAIILGGYSYQIELILQGVDACHNVDRILRLPGTLNWPTEIKIAKYGRTEPSLAELVFWEPSRVYPIKMFHCAPHTVASKAIRGGATRHGFQAPSNTERVSSLEALELGVLESARPGSADELRATIRDGSPPVRFAEKWAKGRSEMVFWVVCELVRAGVPDPKIYSIITDPEWGVSAHVLEQRSNVKRYAERQIDRAHDVAIHPALSEFNEKYAAIEDAGGKCMIIKEDADDDNGGVTYLTPGSFKEFFENRMVKVPTVDSKGKACEQEVPAGHWWWRNPYRRQFDSMCYEPGKITPRRYNLWRGFAVEPIPGGSWSLYKQFLLDNICRGVQRDYDYLIQWMAYHVQHPAEPGHTAVVMQGLQGTGKGTVVEVYASLWGCHFFPLSDGEQLTGKFTGHLRNKSLIYADEAFFAGDYHNEAKMKTLVTERRLNIEDKGLRIRETNNYLKIIIASNKEWVIRAEDSDRRYFVLNTMPLSSNEVRKLREAIIAQLDNGGRSALLYDLLGMDLSKFDIRDVPQTEGLTMQKELSLNGEQTWWHNKLTAAEILPDLAWGKPMQCRLVMDDYYNHFARSKTGGKPIGEAAFGRFLTKVTPDPDHLRVSVNGKNHYKFPPLSVCREHWNTVMRARFLFPPEPELPRRKDEPELAF